MGWAFINTGASGCYKHSALILTVVNDWSSAPSFSFLSHPPEGYVASFEDHASSLIKVIEESLVWGQCSADECRTPKCSSSDGPTNIG